MTEPLLSDDAFIADLDSIEGDPATLHLWWLGQSGFLLEYNGVLLVIDPYLSDSLTRKYEKTDKPHVRMTRRVVDPSRLHVDFILSTHAHTDHLDPDTLTPLIAAHRDVALIYPRAIQSTVNERLGPRTPRTRHPISAGETAREFVTAVPAAHDKLETDEAGNHKYLGYVIRLGPFTIYHSGDTVLYDGMIERLLPHRIDVAILPINGKLGNMTGVEAARLAHAIQARIVIPSHFDMFEFNTASPDAFVAECRRLRQPYHVLKNGGRLTLAGQT